MPAHHARNRPLSDAVRGAQLIICAVTASQTAAVAEACAGQIRGAIFLDFNSASPRAKQEADRLLARTTLSPKNSAP